MDIMKIAFIYDAVYPWIKGGAEKRIYEIGNEGKISNYSEIVKIKLAYCLILFMDLTELFKRVRERFGDEVERIVLFGSYARKDYDKDSDIDLLIVVKNREIEYELRKIVYSFIPRLGRLVSVKVVESEEYERIKNFSFIKSVEKEGVVIG